MRTIPRICRVAMAAVVAGALCVVDAADTRAADRQVNENGWHLGRPMEVFEPTGMARGDASSYLGDAAPSALGPAIEMASRGGRFIGRVDAHNAHKSGYEVSGHVSWTQISGPRRSGRVMLIDCGA